MVTVNVSTSVEYREIPDRPGFRFGTDASIQTAWTLGVKPKIGCVWKTLKTSPRPTGYSWISLGSRKTKKMLRVDEVICEAFYGPRPEGAECLHRDGDRGNCLPSNLAWGLDPWDTKDPNVEYRTLPEADGHEVGSDGSVWSYWATGHEGKTDICRRMTPTPLDRGHLQVGIIWNGERRRFGVHHLVCIAFHGPCPEGMECCHNDGIPDHNEQTNLRWDTRHNNILDQIIHGVMPRGENHYASQFSNEEVINIRQRYANGHRTVKSFAQEYCVSWNAMGSILTGKTYSHLPGAVTVRPADQRKLSDEEEDEVRRVYTEENPSLGVLAKRAGVSKGTVLKILYDRKPRD